MKKLFSVFSLILVIAGIFALSSCGEKKFEDMTPQEQAVYLFTKSNDVIKSATSYELEVNGTISTTAGTSKISGTISGSEILYGLGTEEFFHSENSDVYLSVDDKAAPAVKSTIGYGDGYMYQKYQQGSTDAIRYKSTISQSDYVKFMEYRSESVIDVDPINFSSFDVSVGEKGRYTVKISGCGEDGAKELIDSFGAEGIFDNTKVKDVEVEAVITSSFYPVSMSMRFVFDGEASFEYGAKYYSVGSLEKPDEEVKLGNYTKIEDIRVLYYLADELEERKSHDNGSYTLSAFFDGSKQGSVIDVEYSTDEEGKLTWEIFMKDYGSDGAQVIETSMKYSDEVVKITTPTEKYTRILEESNAREFVDTYLDPFVYNPLAITRMTVETNNDGETIYKITASGGTYVVTVDGERIVTLTGEAKEKGNTTKIIYTWEFNEQETE